MQDIDKECPYLSMRNGKSFGQKTDFSFRLTPELIVVSEPICPQSVVAEGRKEILRHRTIVAKLFRIVA